jgi:hypothetical protein
MIREICMKKCSLTYLKPLPLTRIPLLIMEGGMDRRVYMTLWDRKLVSLRLRDERWEPGDDPRDSAVAD